MRPDEVLARRVASEIEIELESIDRLARELAGAPAGDDTFGLRARGSIPERDPAIPVLARGAVAPGVGRWAYWDDSDGFWLYGGFGLASDLSSGHLNDLWRFDGTAWTQIPGARSGAAFQSGPDGELLLFGGTNRQPTRTTISGTFESDPADRPRDADEPVSLLTETGS